jgi:hypothetical protein
MPITFGGSIFGGVATATTYYVNNIYDSTTFGISSSLVTVSATDTTSGTGAITVASTSALTTFNPIVFSGTTFGNILAGTTYYVNKILAGGTTFTVADSLLTRTTTATIGISDLIYVNSTTGFVANAIARMPALDLSPYATIASPTFTGVPRAPTAGAGTNSTQIATTAFVATRSPVLSVNNKVGEITLEIADITGVAPLASPIFTGAPEAPTPESSDDSDRIATTEWVKNITDPLAPASSPTFIGTVTVPNPADVSNTTVAATTSWVRARIVEADVPKWGGARKWVSTSAPQSSDGSNGDIWFQYVL